MQFFPFLGFGERGKGRNFFFFLLGVGVLSFFILFFLRFFVCSHNGDLP
jgi:hypothetical protein